jgi:hypothetical protein
MKKITLIVVGIFFVFFISTPAINAEESKTLSTKDLFLLNELPGGEYLTTIKLKEGEKIFRRMSWNQENGESILDEEFFITPNGEITSETTVPPLFEGEIIIRMLSFPPPLNEKDFTSEVHKIIDISPHLESLCQELKLSKGAYIATIDADEKTFNLIRFSFQDEITIEKLKIIPKKDVIEEIFDNLLLLNEKRWITEEKVFIPGDSIFNVIYGISGK